MSSRRSRNGNDTNQPARKYRTTHQERQEQCKAAAKTGNARRKARIARAQADEDEENLHPTLRRGRGV